MRATDAIKQGAFTREIIRQIVSRDSLYSKKKESQQPHIWH